MSNLTDFFPSGGGGLTPKFEEFNASGTFTPSQELVDAGGYIEVFLVAGGQRGVSQGTGGTGGEVQLVRMNLSSTTGCAITIGAGGSGSANAAGGNSTFTGSSAGGVDITSIGGGINNQYDGRQVNTIGANWGGTQSNFGPGQGTFGYGAGGGYAGVFTPKANSGQGSNYTQNAGSGYCLIKWYE